MLNLLDKRNLTCASGYSSSEWLGRRMLMLHMPHNSLTLHNRRAWLDFTILSWTFNRIPDRKLAHFHAILYEPFRRFTPLHWYTTLCIKEVRVPWIGETSMLWMITMIRHSPMQNDWNLEMLSLFAVHHLNGNPNILSCKVRSRSVKTTHYPVPHHLYQYTSRTGTSFLNVSLCSPFTQSSCLIVEVTLTWSWCVFKILLDKLKVHQPSWQWLELFAPGYWHHPVTPGFPTSRVHVQTSDLHNDGRLFARIASSP